MTRNKQSLKTCDWTWHGMNRTFWLFWELESFDFTLYTLAFFSRNECMRSPLEGPTTPVVVQNHAIFNLREETLNAVSWRNNKDDFNVSDLWMYSLEDRENKPWKLETRFPRSS